MRLECEQVAADLRGRGGRVTLIRINPEEVAASAGDPETACGEAGHELSKEEPGGGAPGSATAAAAAVIHVQANALEALRAIDGLVYDKCND